MNVIHPAPGRPRDRQQGDSVIRPSNGDMRPAERERRPGVFTSTALVEHALAMTREELRAAQRELDELRRRDADAKKKIAALVQSVAKARRFAHRDELTGLPNRRLLMERFDQAIAQADRQHKQVALLYLDIDGFKDVNDTLGHAAGDELLQQIAARLSACIRLSDTACRYGGDEFVVLLPEIDGEQAAAAATHKIRAQLAAPEYVVGNTEMKLAVSIGTALYPNDGNIYRDLIEVSDRAMYRQKSMAVTRSVSRRPSLTGSNS